MRNLRKSLGIQYVLALLAMVWLAQTLLVVHEHQLTDHALGVECELCLHAGGQSVLPAPAAPALAERVLFVAVQHAVFEAIPGYPRYYQLASVRAPPAPSM